MQQKNLLHHCHHHHIHQDDDDGDDDDDDDDDDQVRAGAGVAAPPGAVSAGTGKGLVCRLLIFVISSIINNSINIDNVIKIITDIDSRSLI